MWQFFLDALQISWTKPSAYSRLISQPWKYSFAWLIVWLFVLGSLLTARINHDVITPSLEQTTTQLRNLPQTFPDNLSFSWATPNWSTTATQPIVIPWPVNDLSHPPLLLAQTLPKDFMVIFPHQLSDETILANMPTSAAVVALPNGLRLPDGLGGWNAVPWTDFTQLQERGELTISRETIGNFQTEIDTLILALKSFQVLLLLIIPVAYVVMQFWSSIIQSFFIYLGLQIFGTGLSWKKSWQLVMHVLVVSESITVLKHVLFPDFEYSLWSEITFWIVMSCVLLSRYRAAQAESSPSL
jgi:hypothetical protein